MSAPADAIHNWADDNNLQLNIGKTKAIVLGSVSYVDE